MTPEEYLIIEQKQQAIIATAQNKIRDARELANKAEPPKRRRAAKTADIVEGAIIWHSQEQKYGGDYWHIVSNPLNRDDPFKAYVADDGCRYGLDGAYIKVPNVEVSGCLRKDEQGNAC